VALSNALPGAPAFCVIGDSTIGGGWPFKGGFFVPWPDILVPLTLQPTGDIVLSAPWPAGLPAHFQLYVQYWIQDVDAPKAFAASGGL
jgi:hypothetical protein